MAWMKNSDRLMFLGFCGMFFFIPISTAPMVIFGGLTLLIWIVSGACIRTRHRWLKEPWLWPVILFAALPWVGLLWTDDLLAGLKLAQKSYYWLYALAMASLSLREDQIKTLIQAFLFGLVISGLIVMMQSLGMVPLHRGLPSGFMHHIGLSLLFVFGILLMSFYFRNEIRQDIKGWILAGMLVCFFGLILGAGRAGHFAFILLAPLIVINLFGRTYLFKTGVVTVGVILVMLLSPSVQNRAALVIHEVKTYQGADSTTSIGMRFRMWEKATHLFLEYPIWGAGTGGYHLSVKKYSEEKQASEQFMYFIQPHNTFLYVASSFGLIGLGLLTWLFSAFFRKGWPMDANLASFAIFSYGLILLVGSLTDTQILSVATGSLFALLIGITMPPMAEVQTVSPDSLSAVKPERGTEGGVPTTGV